MRTQHPNRIIAAFELLLLFPAALFMTALALRNLQPLREPAQQIVMLYAGKQWTLWMLLLALPLTVLITGCATLLRSSNGDVGDWPTRFVATTTLAAGGILVIVVLHMLAN